MAGISEGRVINILFIKLDYNFHNAKEEGRAVLLIPIPHFSTTRIVSDFSFLFM